MARDLLADDLGELLAVVVLVLADLEALGHVLDELQGEIELALARLLGRRELELAHAAHLVREAHELEEDRVAVGLDAGEVLPRADDELRDAHLAGLAERLAQERVGALAAFLGLEVARPLEVLGVDLLGLDEVLDVDRRAPRDVRLLEVLLGELDERAVGLLDPLHDVLPGDLLVAGLAGALVANSPLVFGMQ